MKTQADLEIELFRQIFQHIEESYLRCIYFGRNYGPQGFEYRDVEVLPGYVIRPRRWPDYGPCVMARFAAMFAGRNHMAAEQLNLPSQEVWANVGKIAAMAVREMATMINQSRDLCYPCYRDDGQPSQGT